MNRTCHRCAQSLTTCVHACMFFKALDQRTYQKKNATCCLTKLFVLNEKENITGFGSHDFHCKGKV